MADDGQAELVRKATALEREWGGRLGIAVLDTAAGAPVSWRGDERFALCSTFKVLAVALVLARVDRRQENLDRRLVYAKTDLVPYSPVTESHAGGDGLAFGEICEAAMTRSDNTAANLLLDSFGGPPGLTEYLRSLGDDVTRLDRYEPALNQSSPGDPRDTTTPLAMLRTVREIVLGNALSPEARGQLTAWLVASKTGDKRLRGGLPQGWRVGDKTGSGDNNETNDVALLWPPGRPPLVVTAYYAGSYATYEERDAVLAELGTFIAERYSRQAAP